MTPHPDILDAHEPTRGAFLGALALHAAIFGGLALNGWLAAHVESFGAKDAGGAAVDRSRQLHTSAASGSGEQTRKRVQVASAGDPGAAG